MLLPLHDPGGKVRLRMPLGMRGGARFCAADGGPGDTHRPVLWREWGMPDARPVLFVGMNPSTADAECNDPTVVREIDRAMRWRVSAYRKVNVMDLRATDPRRLVEPGASPRSAMNLKAIAGEAAFAVRVVLAFGALPPPLRLFAEEAVAELRRLRITLWCLGTTADGSPRHPLYLPKSAGLMEWRGFL